MNTTCFVFPGQGSQWLGMGDRLRAESVPFAAEFERCASAFHSAQAWPLSSVTAPTAEMLDLSSPREIQPVLFATMSAIAALWQSYGVYPAAVVGQSQGELVAAYAAGAISLNDAVRVVKARANVLTELIGKGGAISTRTSAENIRSVAEQYRIGCEVAAINSPSNVTVGGTPTELAELIGYLTALRIDCNFIEGVNVAPHSSQVEPYRDAFLTEVGELNPCGTSTKFISSVIGGPMSGRLLDSEYWYRNMRYTVDFFGGLDSALRYGVDTFVEVSPSPILRSSIEDAIALRGSPARYVPSLSSSRASLIQFEECVSTYRSGLGGEDVGIE